MMNRDELREALRADIERPDIEEHNRADAQRLYDALEQEPIIKGGCGRSAEDVESDGKICGVISLALFLVVLWIIGLFFGGVGR